MERIIGINEARPKLSVLIENMDKPVIITINSEPKSVLLSYDQYIRLAEAEKNTKRLALQLAVEKARCQAHGSEINEEDISKEIRAHRAAKRGLPE